MLKFWRTEKPEEIREEIREEIVVNQAEALKIAKDEYLKKQIELEKATKNLQRTFRDVVNFEGYWSLESKFGCSNKQYIKVVKNCDLDYRNRCEGGYKVTIIIPKDSRESLLSNDRLIEQVLNKVGIGARFPYPILYTLNKSAEDLKRTFENSEVDLVSKEFFKEKLNEHFGI